LTDRDTLTSFASTDPHVIGSWISIQAELGPDRVAIIFENRQVTYRELDETSASWARAFAGRGLAPGDRIATLTENRPEHVALLFACAKAGVILFPMNWRLTNSELERQLRMVEPTFLIASELQFARVDDAIITAAGEVLCLEHLATQLPSDDHGGELPTVTAEDGLMIIATSGSTGRPKGVLLTHANFFWTNLSLDLAAPINRDDVVLQVMPEFHVGGWNVQPMLAWRKGATVVLEPSFEPSRVLQLIKTHGITTMAGVPTTYVMIGRDEGFDDADMSTLRFAVVGGAAMPRTATEQWRSKGVSLVLGYGLSEAAPNVLCLRTANDDDRPGSVGHPYPYVEVALVDQATDAIVYGPGRGELLVRGPSVFKGYWRDADSTAAVFREGWLRTGDVAQRDSAGYFTIVGRCKEMFVSGGENVFPIEVESAITSFNDVMNAAVVWIDDELWGEVGVAFIEAKPGARIDLEALQRHCRSLLPSYKVPVRFHVLDELPRSTVGKLDKASLRTVAQIEARGEGTPVSSSGAGTTSPRRS
jgi:fatty-acyl-CoA synthase